MSLYCDTIGYSKQFQLLLYIFVSVDLWVYFDSVFLLFSCILGSCTHVRQELASVFPLPLTSGNVVEIQELVKLLVSCKVVCFLQIELDGLKCSNLPSFDDCCMFVSSFAIDSKSCA